MLSHSSLDAAVRKPKTLPAPGVSTSKLILLPEFSPLPWMSPGVCSQPSPSHIRAGQLRLGERLWSGDRCLESAAVSGSSAGVSSLLCISILPLLGALAQAANPAHLQPGCRQSSPQQLSLCSEPRASRPTLHRRAANRSALLRRSPRSSHPISPGQASSRLPRPFWQAFSWASWVRAFKSSHELLG